MERQIVMSSNTWSSLLGAAVLSASGFFATGCSPLANHGSGLSNASASDRLKNCAQAVASNPSQEDMKRLEFLETAAKDVNEHFPVPDADPNMNLYRVSSVSDEGILALQDGRAIKIGGVRCSPAGIRTIAKMFASDGELRVGWGPSITEGSTLASDDVWLVEGEPRSRSYSRLQETAITSGWCEPDESGPPSELHNRYVALRKVRAEYVAHFGSEVAPACTQ